MTLQRQENIDELKWWFTHLESYVRANKFSRHQDINIELENFFRDALNRIFDWNLGNANKLFGLHQDSFDLCDTSKKIAVQVTVTQGANKIRKTLGKFIGKYNEDYDRLILVYPYLQLAVSKADFSKALKGYPFDPSKDRLCLGSILTEFQDLKIELQKNFLDFIFQAMGLKPSPSGETFRFFISLLDYDAWSTIEPDRIHVMT